jgi:peptidyl-tRNA hydrolase, PTH1 family
MRLRLPLFGRSHGAVQWLIVGLGNPGRKYAMNRHNVGFHIVSLLAEEHGWAFDETRSQGLMARGTLGDTKVALVKPQTYMNLSGRTVAPISRFYKVPPERIVVIYDDIDLPLGKLRLRPNGGAGGHNGMRSIIDTLGTQQFPRLRIGIDRPPGRMPVEAYVLQDFRPDERAEMAVTYQDAAQAVRMIVTEGFEAAMNAFNRNAAVSD